jgi:hypothetical protein
MRTPNAQDGGLSLGGEFHMWRFVFALFLALTVVSVATASAPDWCRYGHLPPVTGAESVGMLAPGNHTLAIFYAVPMDVPYNPAVLARIKRAAADIQSWYQCASGGVTWEFAYPETVRVYHGLRARQYYKDNGDWWGSLPGEMGAAGLPIWSAGTVSAIWAHGAGWWAGAAQWCGVECGTALLGVEVFPEFNNPGYSGGNCPGGTGGAAWPCTPEGAFAHELGHTVGLPHPVDVPATSAVASHSVMQTHWEYPSYAPPVERPWGVLTLERQTLLVNPFMKWSITLRQQYAGCDVVNLPAAGPAPIAAFTIDPTSPPNTFHGLNMSSGATYSYWTFGDEVSSNLANPTHTYGGAGLYAVTLRAMAGDAMMDTAAALIEVPVAGVALREESRGQALAPNQPNPFGVATRIVFRLREPGLIHLSIVGADGRRIRTLASGFRPAGEWPTLWDGVGDDGRHAPPGVYYCHLATALGSWTRSMVLRR